MKNNKGITLIALIITIIVMLILVGVTVVVVVNSNLIGTAQGATEKYNEAVKNQTEQLENLDSYLTQFETIEVDNIDEFKTAMEKGGQHIIINKTIEIDETIPVNGNVIITLGEEACLDLSSLPTNSGGWAFEITNGANLIINGNEKTSTIGGKGLILVGTYRENIPTVEYASITINGLNFEGSTNTGSIIAYRAGVGEINVKLNDVTWIDTSSTGYALSTSGRGTGTVEINGGHFEANYGLHLTAGSKVTGTTIVANGTGIEIFDTNRSGKETIIENCNITTKGKTVGTAQCAGVAVSNYGKAKVNDCIFAGNMEAALYIYSVKEGISGIYIVATNINYSEAVCARDIGWVDPFASNDSFVTIDGIVYKKIG